MVKVPFSESGICERAAFKMPTPKQSTPAANPGSVYNQRNIAKGMAGHFLD